MLKQVAFTDVIYQDDRYATLLLDRDTRRVFSIGVEVHEGAILSWVSQGAPNIWGEPRRQSIHQFVQAVLAEAGVEIRQCVVHQSPEKGDFCRLHLRRGRAARSIQARPADAVALALLADRPLLLALDGAAPSWDMETIYGRTPLGRHTQHLVKALAQFWQESDPRIHQNTVYGANSGTLNAGASAVLVPISLVDILGSGPVEKTAVFRSSKADTFLPVRMPAWEAATLAHLSRNPAPGGLRHTYQLAAELLAFAGYAALNARMYDLRSGIYLAALEMQHEENSLHFDLRPVDAACLAAVLDIPLFATTGVLDAAGSSPEELYASRLEIGQGLERSIAGAKQPHAPQNFFDRLGQTLRGI